ncbi:MAG: hypothetical protein M3280_12340 [Actinomycetota bacterium]|nr:hypothetical protein [Actinomycetota bacterium]
MSSPRAQPFYCPFCGEQDFVPEGDEAGRFLCNSCDRYFVVRFEGLALSTRANRGKDQS